jgi:hypothetical protein
MLVDSHGMPLNPKLRQEAAKPQLGWIICKMVDNGVYIPVMDARTNTLGIAPAIKDAEDLANLLCQRELQPKPGAMLKPGQASSVYAILRLIGEGIVQVTIDGADKLVGGKNG